MQWAFCPRGAVHCAQERLRQELVLASIGRKELPVEEAELPFTEMVVHESLRLYPPNWMLILRRCSDGFRAWELRVRAVVGCTSFRTSFTVLPAGSRGPCCFDPDRFAPENLGVAQRSAFMPLGLGPRVCIGKALSDHHPDHDSGMHPPEIPRHPPSDHPELKARGGHRDQARGRLEVNGHSRHGLPAEEKAVVLCVPHRRGVPLGHSDLAARGHAAILSNQAPRRGHAAAHGRRGLPILSQLPKAICVSWMDWYNSLAKPSWTPAPPTIGADLAGLVPDHPGHLRRRVRAGVSGQVAVVGGRTICHQPRGEPVVHRRSSSGCETCRWPRWTSWWSGRRSSAP